MSNRERIARAAAEAAATAAEKAAKAEKKASKKPAAPRAKRAAKTARVKIVWEVCSASGKTIKTFAYPDKAVAEAEILALTKSSGRTHILRATKVPMD